MFHVEQIVTCLLPFHFAQLCRCVILPFCPILRVQVWSCWQSFGLSCYLPSLRTAHFAFCFALSVIAHNPFYICISRGLKVYYSIYATLILFSETLLLPAFGMSRFPYRWCKGTANFCNYNTLITI